MPRRHPDSLHFTLNWQQQLSEAFTKIEDLCAYLELAIENLPTSSIAAKQFQMRVPLSFAEAMEKGNPDDPLLRQVLPVNDELVEVSGFIADPVGDLNSVVMPGLLHKYHGRALLINTGACAINCRYCFRRNFPYQDMQLSKQQESQVIEHIQQDSTLSEIILSGGDPLLLNDARLAQLIRHLETINHIKRIRIHTRLPIVLPARITKAFADLLADSKKKIILVVHCNHANELTENVEMAIRRIRHPNITLLNQSVLLKGINDQADVLCTLSEKLFDNGILPYYLHILDKAIGTGHFAVSDNDAKGLIEQVQHRLPGYLVPKLVKEIAGAESKQIVL
ncbi:MAG: EF-P beta-lysylation protein EpmB [Methylococcaceae bacterium]|nr:EF-P beta-lysylation protein EpmB [Methylococcaceae bacterium]